MNKQDYMLKLGEKIKTHRIEKGYTQQELANMCNRTRSWLCKIETGVNDVPIPELKKIAKALNVDTISFIDDVVIPFDTCENAFKIDLSKEDRQIIENIHKLSKNGKQKVIERINELLQLEGIE